MNADLEAQRQALAARVRAATEPRSSADVPPVVAACAGDPALRKRVEDALNSGWQAPPLDGIYQHARPALLVASLDVWDRDRAGGPCAFCGTKTPRGAATEPGPHSRWTTVGERKACHVCAREIAQDGLATFTVKMAAALGGMTGWPILQAVPDLPIYAWECPGAGDGTAWSHADRMAIRQALADTFGSPQMAQFSHGFQMPGVPRVMWGLVTPHRVDPPPPVPHPVLSHLHERMDEDKRHREEADARVRRSERRTRAVRDGWLEIRENPSDEEMDRREAEYLRHHREEVMS